MARETAREIAIESSVESPVYVDQKQITRNLGSHLAEAYIGQITGAGGAGGTLSGVPFDPALIEVLNEAGATPTTWKFVNLASGGIGVTTAAAVADATASFPTVTRVAGPPITWDVAVPTAVAPDTEVVTVICYGARDVAGGL